MKIISGKYKGRNLEGYNLEGTRPTMDRVKESLFAMLQEYIPEKTVLDLFAGSGALGLEALSEGAKYAYLCDNNFKAIKTIKKNIENINIDNVQVMHNDYKKCLEELSEKTKIDVIFIDPPYDTDYIEKSLILIDKFDILNNDGIIICESNDLNKIIYNDNYTCIKEKKYGDKFIVLLRKI